MATLPLYSTLVVVACAMVTACASDSPDRQRPAYSYENVDMQPNQSGRQYRVDEPPPQTNDPYSGRYGR